MGLPTRKGKSAAAMPNPVSSTEKMREVTCKTEQKGSIGGLGIWVLCKCISARTFSITVHSLYHTPIRKMLVRVLKAADRSSR